MKRLFSFLAESLRLNRTVIVAASVLYFSLVIAGMLLAAAFPALQKNLVGNVTGELDTLLAQFDALTGGALSAWIRQPGLLVVLAGAAAIFLVNLILGSFLEITLPSLIIPFSGLVIGIVRALMWGLLFSPFHAQQWVSAPVFLNQMILLLLEGEGYVLALAGAFVQGRALFFPHTVGQSSRLHSYWQGVRQSLALLACGAAVLALAGLYESVLIFWIIPRLTG